jgi:hypothetical protein
MFHFCLKRFRGTGPLKRSKMIGAGGEELERFLSQGILKTPRSNVKQAREQDKHIDRPAFECFTAPIHVPISM